LPVVFRILPEHGLIRVRYSGTAGMDETLRAMDACANHPDFRPHFRHLVDFRAIDAIDADYPAFLAIQARAIDQLLPQDIAPFVIYLADSPLSQKAARMAMRSWEGVTSIVAMILEDESAAFELLGVTGQSLDPLQAG